MEGYKKLKIDREEAHDTKEAHDTIEL